ncbi:MAG: secretin and TonB N-terminal domain-containing protein [Planctomycetales bacterium]|nr:secretin and TonB N-terminal domain-containing protein [Planctomycetales bacterium]
MRQPVTTIQGLDSRRLVLADRREASRFLTTRTARRLLGKQLTVVAAVIAVASLSHSAHAQPPAPSNVPVLAPPEATLSGTNVATPLAGGSDAGEQLNGPMVNLQAVLQKRGDLSLRNATLSEALFAVSEAWNVSIVYGKDIEGSANAVFRDATLAEVLDSLLLANGYGYQPRGNNLVVMRLADLGDSNGMLQTLNLSLPNGDVQVVDSVRLLLSPQGKAQPLANSNLLVVRDFPEHLDKVRRFLQSVSSSQIGAMSGAMSGAIGPAPSAGAGQGAVTVSPVLINNSEVAYFAPQFVSVTSIESALNTVLTGARIAIVEDENRVLVVADSRTVELARQVVKQLDRPRPQVRISAMIYDVSLEELERLGVNWTHAVKSSPNGLGVPRHSFGTHFGQLPLDPTNFQVLTDAAAAAADATTTATIPTLGATRLMTLNRYFDLSAIINALDETKGARLLADPTVTVLDREDAVIKIVTEIPIQQLTQTSQGGAIGTTTFREAGVTLSVRPQIASDDTVQMEVTPTFSVLAGFNQGQPIIDSREAKTKVRVGNGQTLVIGGLRQRTETENTRGVPGIKDVKRIGALFRDHDTSVRESELLVFLRPEICGCDAMKVREQIAGEHCRELLRRLPAPTDCSMFPDCRDKHCPLHVPRPRGGQIVSDEDEFSNGFTGGYSVDNLPQSPAATVEEIPVQSGVDQTDNNRGNSRPNGDGKSGENGENDGARHSPAASTGQAGLLRRLFQRR